MSKDIGNKYITIPNELTYPICVIRCFSSLTEGKNSYTEMKT